jgi:hypothetical protein
MSEGYVNRIAVKLICICLMAVPLAAHGSDSAPSLICVPAEIMECYETGECHRVTPESMDFPRFLKINFEKKIIRGILADGEVRTVKIQQWKSFEGKLVLHGVQKGRGWSLVLTEPAGKMTIAVSDDDGGIMIFGACVVP